MPSQDRTDSGARSERKFTLIAGRIHATQGIKEEKVSDEDLARNLLVAMKESEGVNQPATRKGEASTWVLGDARRKDTDSGAVIFGRLGRLRPGFERDTFDRERHQFKTAPVDMETATGYVDFVVDVANRAVIYEERLPTISDRQFRTYFKLIYTTHTKQFQNIDITPLSSSEDIYTFIEGLDQLTFISAKVMPSNPEVSRDYASLDEQLRKAGASDAVISLSSQHGLKTKDTLVSEAVALAADGYGEVTLKGQRNQEEKSLRSSKNIVREEIGKHRDSPDELIEIFRARLKAIIERARKK